ncbi:MAG: chemotaxis protein CheA [Spirochaetes bacterium]|nr:MAG: chemotaxis protein CheA [Spirochaetota bacterium]
MSDYLDPNNEELLKDFYVEAELQVEGLEQNILVLENDPGNSDAVDEIFRAAHTLKGAAATVQMNELASFTHLVEDVLDEIRSGNISIDEAVIDVLLGSIDVIKAMLEARSSGGVYEEDISSIKDGLSRILEGKDASTPKVEEPAAKSAPESGEESIEVSEVTDSLTEYDILELLESAESGESVYEIKVSFNEDHPMNTVGAVQVFAALKGFGMVLKTIPDFDKLYDDIFLPEVFYYIAASESVERLQKAVDIPGAVTGVDIKKLESPSAAVPSASEAEGEEKKKPGKTEEKSAVQAPPLEKTGTGTRTTDLKKSRKGSSVLRVDSKRIDNLLNLVSETVITKATFNQIGSRFSEVQRDFSNTLKGNNELLRKLFSSFPGYLEKLNNGEPLKDIKTEFFDEFGSVFTMWSNFESDFKNTVVKLHSTSQSLARTTGELQEGVMEIRMVPISQIFSRFPRLVRDASKMLNKKIKLVIEGEETELDKSVIEDLLDPLIHCVRNSVDHGIESPAERQAAGKPAEGQVLLKASNEGNMIVINIEDDGKGIDVKSVYDKAVERGVIHPSKILSDIEAFNLIFEPGFSTAKEVTDISGRGVGLDVVRKQIEKLNGNVSVWSEKGKGTKLTIKIPLTLAIIQGLLVRVGTEIYAIPITSVIDSHRIKQSDIRMIDNYEVFNVREDVVSLIRLNRLFNIRKDEDGEYHFVVVVGSGDKKMGLMVDSLIGEEDVVIKPLMDKFTNSPGIAGATILGDGMVALIIDVSQLLELGLKKEREHRQHLSASIV